MGLPWQPLISPPGVMEAGEDTWIEHFWWLVDSLSDDLPLLDVREPIVTSLRLNPRQCRWLLPKVVMRKAEAYPALFAFVLHGLVAIGRARAVEVGLHTLVLDYRGKEFGIRNNKVISTEYTVPPFNYRRYLSGGCPWTPGVSVSLKFNTIYRAMKAAKDDEAMLLMRSLFWNATHLSRLETMVSALGKEDQQEKEEGAEDADPIGAYW
jgi:hypothetical protein